VDHVGHVQGPIRAMLDLVLATRHVQISIVVVIVVVVHVGHVAPVKRVIQMDNVLQVVDLVGLVVELVHQDVDHMVMVTHKPLICLIPLIWEQVESVVPIMVHNLNVKSVLQLVEYILVLIRIIMLHKQTILQSLFDVEGINNKFIQLINIMALHQLV